MKDNKKMEIEKDNKKMDIEITPNIYPSNDIVIINNSYTKINNNYINFEIVDVNIEKIKHCNITQSNNKLTIFLDKYIDIELEPDYYNRYELVDIINENLIDVKCYLDLNDNFNFKSNNIFSLHNEKNSILPLLGFNESEYKNKNNYTSSTPLYNDNIYYITFENLNSEPIIKINLDDNDKLFTKLRDINFNQDNIITKIYKTPNSKNNLNIPFDLKLKLMTL